MDLLALLFAGHMAGDFLLQTAWMARLKSARLYALLAHSLVYTAAVGLFALLAGGLRWYALLLLFITHALLDQRGFVKWWCKHITGSEDLPWLLIVTDQAWHLVCLVAAYALNMQGY